jgi:hypothetical protein
MTSAPSMPLRIPRAPAAPGISRSNKTACAGKTRFSGSCRAAQHRRHQEQDDSHESTPCRFPPPPRGSHRRTSGLRCGKPPTNPRKTSPAPPCSEAAATAWSSHIPRKNHSTRPASGTPASPRRHAVPHGLFRDPQSPPARLPASPPRLARPPIPHLPARMPARPWSSAWIHPPRSSPAGGSIP